MSTYRFTYVAPAYITTKNTIRDDETVPNILGTFETNKLPRSLKRIRKGRGTRLENNDEIAPSAWTSSRCGPRGGNYCCPYVQSVAAVLVFTSGYSTTCVNLGTRNKLSKKKINIVYYFIVTSTLFHIDITQKGI